MTKRERVEKALNCQPVDRPPVGFWFHYEGAQAKGQPCIDGHLAFYNNVDVDICKIMCDSYFPYPIPETVKEPQDFASIEPLDRNHPFIAEQLERAKGVKDGLKDDMCVYYNVCAPFSYIRFGSSDELVMRAMKEAPEAVQHALDAIAKTVAMFSELLITEAGMDGIYYCLHGGEKSRFSYEEYRRLITPSDLYVLQHANRFSENNIMHCCGGDGNPNRMEIWQDYPCKAVNWAVYVEKMGLNEGQKFFGGKAVLGGFAHTADSLLQTGTKEEVQALANKLNDEFLGEGLMFGADCSLAATTDPARIGWVVEAAKGMAK